MKSTHLTSGGFVTHAVKLVRPLAEGGMGRVWLAEHDGLKAEVVVKLMADEIAARPDGAERFAREAAIAAAIKSPHVVQVFDHGVTADGTPYIVMERLEGRDLAAHLAEQGRMEPRDVLTLVVQVGKALSKAHRESIVHRDIKPDNIFLCDTDGGELFVKLLDFGTARRDGPLESSATVPGQIMGTPHYMSPEQSVGGEIDERSDIWSLGVVAFEALTGKKPFDGASVGAITIAIHGVLPTMIDLVPDLPPALDAWFARACAQSPSERFANVRELTDALAVAVTGTALVDQATEAIFFPVSPSTRASTPPRPVTRPIAPLSASLPAPGAAQRPTAIAAGIVMVATAAAMIGIVLHRSPAPPASDLEPAAAEAPLSVGGPLPATGDLDEAPGAEPARAAQAATAPPRESTRGPAPTTPRTAQASGAQVKGATAKAAPPAKAKAPAPPAKVTTAKAQPATAQPATAQPATTTAKAPPPAKAPQGGAAASTTDDDDLLRLTQATTKATSERAERGEEPAAAPGAPAAPAPPTRAESPPPTTEAPAAPSP